MREIVSALICLSLVLIASAAFDPDTNRDSCGVVKAKGYPCEVHYVTTEDGYILTVFRIPGGRGSVRSDFATAKPAVLLFHGLVDDSFTWIVNFPGQSLSYMLADAGFDVWMGNARGNRFALNHSKLKTSDPAFWAFSWDQQAQYDVPNTVDYILLETNNTRIFYVGHSQGTTQAFAAFSSNPVLAEKIVAYAALAPVMVVGHMSNTLLKLLSDMDPQVLLKLLGIREFLGTSSMPFPINKAIELICLEDPSVCETVIELWVGATQAIQNESRLQVISAHEPGGTSTQNMIHWMQMFRSGNFQKFDYGLKGNLLHYGQAIPPMYNISQFPAKLPTALYIGGQDELADPRDVATLISSLPSKPLVVSMATYAHMDFVWALNANSLVYDSLVGFFQKYL